MTKLPTGICASVFLAVGLASAQFFSLGVKAGIPLNTLMTASPGYRASTARYTLGPSVELGFVHHLAFEVDLLYKRVKYGLSTAVPTASARWELPFLLKYTFPTSPVRPFVGLGVSFNRVMGTAGYPAELRHRSATGFVGGAGIETALGFLRVAPEVRVTHWVDRNFGVRDSVLRSNLTQATFLLGIRIAGLRPKRSSLIDGRF
jgi:opacity protein-like surface antigen